MNLQRFRLGELPGIEGTGNSPADAGVQDTPAILLTMVTTISMLP
jgi:hypothetical protein